MFCDLRTGMVHWAQQLSLYSIQRVGRLSLSASASADTKHGTRHTRQQKQLPFYIFKKYALGGKFENFFTTTGLRHLDEQR